MAKRKQTRRARTAPPAELREEAQLRRLVARIRVAQAKAMLSTYHAAGKGRQNKDWKANATSADMAIIPDGPVLNARARQAVRDTWIGASMVRAAKRNVAGTGIDVVPAAKDETGSPLAVLNRRIRDHFWRWASDKRYCDREKRQNFWQKQRLCVAERYTVGQAMVVWSYVPNLTPRGEVNKAMPVGLRLQSFEPEQLDVSLTSYEGREVRGGLEMDPDSGATVAFHFYTRNPNDYLSRVALKSTRVEATRVFHYAGQERVLQSHGVSQFAPVLQDIRDFDSYRQATIWRARMEACIGAIVKQAAGQAPGYSPVGVQAAAGDSRQTSSGMSEMDFVPGMVPHLAPGEDVVPFTPAAPGNQYQPFTTVSLRGIGAGVGMSYDQVSRHSDSNYSAARQNMLEDWREWEIEQDDLICDFILPTYELFLRLAILEGRFDNVEGFDAGDFALDPMRYTDAVCVPPARPWIDPEKEMNAYKTGIDYRLVTREEVMTSRGRRLSEQLAAIGDERKMAAENGLRFPEDVESRTKMAAAEKDAADAQTKVEDAKDKRFARKTGAKQATQPPPEQPQPKQLSLLALAESADKAPNYRTSVLAEANCAGCRHFMDGRCSAYGFDAARDGVCDAFETPDVGDQARRATDGPGVMEGDLPMDDPRGDHMNEGARGVEGD